jgi:hypothetical protein
MQKYLEASRFNSVGLTVGSKRSLTVFFLERTSVSAAQFANWESAAVMGLVRVFLRLRILPMSTQVRAVSLGGSTARIFSSSSPCDKILASKPEDAMRKTNDTKDEVTPEAMETLVEVLRDHVENHKIPQTKSKRIFLRRSRRPAVSGDGWAE